MLVHLERKILEKYGYPTADGMVESALHHIKILEDLRFPRYYRFYESI